MHSEILFLCTGNYYRSRFAEAVFNHHATAKGLPWRAFSRGLAIHLVDGPISIHTEEALRERAIDRAHTAEGRQQLAEDDLKRAARTIALKRDEHHPLMTEQFPGWVEKIEYWGVHDLDFALPEEALPQIEAAVLRLVDDLAALAGPGASKNGLEGRQGLPQSAPLMFSATALANPEVAALVPYEPGKPIEDVARELGLEPDSIIKLASNENPLGPSPKALDAIREALPKLHLYPDGAGYHLRTGIAAKFGLELKNVVLGNGSNEIIELAYHTFTRPGVHEIVTSKNSFAVYELMAQLFGVRCRKVAEKDGFHHDLDAMLAAITPATRLVFVASPNNPTGTRLPNEALDRFLAALPEHVVAVIDEAYYEFLDNPPDTLGAVKAGKKVILMRTFSKIQGLAGLRIGYALTTPEIAGLLERARQPFNTNMLAQVAALAGLRDEEHQRKTKEMTDAGRQRLQGAFAERGLKFVASEANFVLVEVGDAAAVFKKLMAKGIIVRSMVSYRLPAWIRVSIGTPEQNERFLAELPGALAA